jgi:hypothetical protein
MNGRELTVAAIQMSSTPDKDENLATAEQLIHAPHRPARTWWHYPNCGAATASKKPIARTPNPYPE